MSSSKEAKEAYIDSLQRELRQIDDNGWERWMSEKLQSEAYLLAHRHWGRSSTTIFPTRTDGLLGSGGMGGSAGPNF